MAENKNSAQIFRLMVENKQVKTEASDSDDWLDMMERAVDKACTRIESLPGVVGLTYQQNGQGGIYFNEFIVDTISGQIVVEIGDEELSDIWNVGSLTSALVSSVKSKLPKFSKDDVAKASQVIQTNKDNIETKSKELNARKEQLKAILSDPDNVSDYIKKYISAANEKIKLSDYTINEVKISELISYEFVVKQALHLRYDGGTINVGLKSTNNSVKFMAQLPVSYDVNKGVILRDGKISDNVLNELLTSYTNRLKDTSDIATSSWKIENSVCRIPDAEFIRFGDDLISKLSAMYTDLQIEPNKLSIDYEGYIKIYLRCTADFGSAIINAFGSKLDIRRKHTYDTLQPSIDKLINGAAGFAYKFDEFLTTGVVNF